MGGVIFGQQTGRSTVAQHFDVFSVMGFSVFILFILLLVVSLSLNPLSIDIYFEMTAGLNLTIIVGIVGNVLSVVGIVICNKYITEIDGYNFMVFLSFLHFLFTMIGTRVMLMMGYFTYTSAPISGILPVAIGSLLSVAFMNLNLSHNSVGFYQV